jgi:predicted nuclease of predicted toxin-antitoxin system
MRMPTYLLDENVTRPDKIIGRCEAEGIEVIRVHQIGLNETDDPEIFRYAMEQGYIVITGNIRDFRPEQKTWLEGGNEFPGVIYLSTVHYRNVEDIIRMIIAVEAEYATTDLREWWV